MQVALAFPPVATDSLSRNAHVRAVIFPLKSRRSLLNLFSRFQMREKPHIDRQPRFPRGADSELLKGFKWDI